MLKKKKKENYLTPVMAGMQLLQCALEHILAVDPQYGVKWSLSISFQNPEGKWMHTVSFMSSPGDDQP